MLAASHAVRERAVPGDGRSCTPQVRPDRINEIAVRTGGVAPSALVDAIRTTMMSLDADLPARRLQPATDAIARANYDLGVLRNLELFSPASRDTDRVCGFPVRTPDTPLQPTSGGQGSGESGSMGVAARG